MPWILHREKKKKDTDAKDGWGSRVGSKPNWTGVDETGGVWTHIAITYNDSPTPADGTECGITVEAPAEMGLLKIYVNGALEECARASEPSVAGSLLLGARHIKSPNKKQLMQGAVDELSFFEGVISTEAVQTIAAGATTPAEMADIVDLVGQGCTN